MRTTVAITRIAQFRSPAPNRCGDRIEIGDEANFIASVGSGWKGLQDSAARYRDGDLICLLGKLLVGAMVLKL